MRKRKKPEEFKRYGQIISEALAKDNKPLPVAYVGIDPGKSGGAALIHSENSIEFMDWPLDDDMFFVSRAMREWSKRFDIRGGILEQVGAMPGQGVTSCFTFGSNFGAWKMLLATLDIRHQILLPQNWQKGILKKGDGREPKERVKNVATRMFGYDHFFGPRGGYKDGRGDAALMAHKARLIGEGLT